jgi:abortive infection bacteriophage resistance protein
VTAAKVFKTHAEQIALLRSRGMIIDDPAWARHVLERVNYYRLSGYWYSFRVPDHDGRSRADRFSDGTDLVDVVALYDFDIRLRTAVFATLGPIELVFRSMLGHELGRIDPLVHLQPRLLGPVARLSGSDAEPSSTYTRWRNHYQRELAQSREDFVAHHRRKYGGHMPIWAAVEVMDWGQMAYLFQLAPIDVRDRIATRTWLTAAQLGSWLKSLNVLRNYSAHHARMFNRVYTLKPRLPRGTMHPGLAELERPVNRTFGHLCLIQYLGEVLDAGDSALLPSVLATYPTVPLVPISHCGVPDDWQNHPLWRSP